MHQDARNARKELRDILTLILKSPSGSLDWVSVSAGVAKDKVLSFLGTDVVPGDDKALVDIEVHFLLDWYYFAGPT